MPPIALYRYVRHLEQQHQQAVRYEQELWRKVSIPLSLIAMIMIATPFVFGSPRARSTGYQIMIGAGFGIVFSLCQQIAGHLDLLLDLNPAAIALAPSLLLMALAGYLFRRADG
jgi:lipopolysaccharide export system permease protein